MLQKMFNPSSIALIGASREKGSVGQELLKNLLKSNKTVYAINPYAKSILGQKCFPSVKDVKRVDLAIIAVPAKIVPKVLIECGEKKIKNAIIISAGFAEVGNIKLDDEIRHIGRKYKINILGPNCMGFINKNVNASFFKGDLLDGSVTFISQSGALGAGFLDWLIDENIGLANFVSIGNMTVLNFADMITYFSKDSKTKVICLYIESFKDARRFLKECKKCKKPIIAMKSGGTTIGKKAASSHTGALATDERIIKGVFKQHKIIQVNKIEDLIYTSLAAAWQPRPKGKRVMVITNAGGLGVISADSIQKYGLKLSDIPKKELNNVLPSNWSHSNPVDIVGDAKAERYRKVFRVLLKNENLFDIALVILTPQAMTEPLKTGREVMSFAEKLKKPCYTCFVGGERVEEAVEMLERKKIPFFEEPEEAIKAISLLRE